MKLRDGQRLQTQIEKGQGAVWQPDLNKGQMSAAVAVMENLGILGLLVEGEVRATDAVVQRIASIALANRRDIKTALNISINDKDTPIAITQKLLGKSGIKLVCLRREGPRGHRQRVYSYTHPDDGRDEVFTVWLVRDKDALAAAETAGVKTASTALTSDSLVSTPGNKEISPGLDTDAATDTQVVSTPSNKVITTSLPDTKQEVAGIPSPPSPLTTSADKERQAWGVGLLMPGSIVEWFGRAGQWTVRYCTSEVAKICDHYGDEKIVDCKYLRLAGMAA